MDIRALVTGPWHRQGSPYRLMLGLMYANLLCWNFALAQQRMSGTFGACVERSLPYSPVDIALGPRFSSVQTSVAVLTEDPPALALYGFSDSTGLAEMSRLALDTDPHSLTGADMDGDGRTDFLLPSKTGSCITLLRLTPRGWVSDTLGCDVMPQRLVVTDINNDRRNDILVFGRSSAGVATFLQQKNGRFARGPVLFADISVSDLYATDVNGDGIVDVFLLDWLKNQLMLFYGISNAFFSEQVIVALPGEPGTMSKVHIQRGRQVLAAIALPGARRVAIVDGSVTGELRVRQVLSSPGTPEKVVLADVNGDRRPDLLTGTARGIAVRLAQGDGGFGAAALFGFGAGKTPWTLHDADADGLVDLVVADAARRRLILSFNGARPVPESATLYAAGPAPADICTTDLDGDGSEDILLGSSAVSSVSALLNQGDGRFSGLFGIPTPIRPLQVVAAGELQEGVTLVLADASGDRLGVVKVARDVTVTSAYSMPTGRNPFVLDVRQAGEGRSLAMVVRSDNPRQRAVSLSLYEQIAGRQFLERHLRPLIPGRITAATLDRSIPADAYSLVFVSHDPQTRRASVNKALGSPEFSFRSVSSLLQYRDSLSATRVVKVLPSVGDSGTSVLLYRAFPSNTIAIARADSVSGGNLRWVPGIQPVDPDHLSIRDVNGDGREDVVFLAATPRMLKVAYQGEDGVLLPPVDVCDAGGVTAFALASLRRPGETDAILARSGEGTVAVLYNPFGAR